MNVYTYEEVARHRTDGDAWTIIQETLKNETKQKGFFLQDLTNYKNDHRLKHSLLHS